MLVISGSDVISEVLVEVIVGTGVLVAVIVAVDVIVGVTVGVYVAANGGIFSRFMTTSTSVFAITIAGPSSTRA